MIVAPEYNGSFPGVLKAFIDGVHPENFRYKKVSLVGVSSGRAGNVIGMEHLNSILTYLQMFVMPQKLPISRITDLIQNNELTDAATIRALENHVELFLKF